MMLAQTSPFHHAHYDNGKSLEWSSPEIAGLVPEA